MSKRFTKSDYQEWKRLYEVEMWSTLRIAGRYDCDAVNIKTRLIKLGVQIRSMKEARNTPYAKERHKSRRCSEETKLKMSKAHYTGKIDALGYTGDFNTNSVRGKKLHKLIYERDGYVCQDCGKPYESGSGKFEIHHIDFNKLNNNPENLVLLCVFCHKIRHKKHKKQLKEKNNERG